MERYQDTSHALVASDEYLSRTNTTHPFIYTGGHGSLSERLAITRGHLAHAAVPCKGDGAQPCGKVRGNNKTNTQHTFTDTHTHTVDSAYMCHNCGRAYCQKHFDGNITRIFSHFIKLQNGTGIGEHLVRFCKVCDKAKKGTHTYTVRVYSDHLTEKGLTEIVYAHWKLAKQGKLVPSEIRQ